MVIEENLNTPLVSIVVITYNSSKYVLETLESAKAQTYQNIELIVTDDCSSDNTVAVCEKWIKENKERFVRTELITVTKNIGITPNCNRGVKAAAGEWVKVIAGDDILKSLCLDIFISSIDDNSNIIVSELLEFICSKDFYSNEQMEGNMINPIFINLNTPEKQFEYFLNGFYIPGSSTFMKSDVLKSYNYFDEKYNMVEDRPLFLKYTFYGEKIKYISNITVGHRRHSAAVTSKSNLNIVPKYLVQTYQAIFYYSKLQKSKKYFLNSSWHNFTILIILKLGNRSFIAHFINRIRLTFQPIRFFNLLNKLKLILNA